MANAYPTNPMYLLGGTFDFTETLLCGDVYRYRAHVLAVQVPCPGTDVEWSLLLERPGEPDPVREYVDLDSLTFDWGAVYVQSSLLNSAARH
jgi:hypothetical protein